MDNFNTNIPNQNNSGYTFNTPYANNPYMNNQGNQYMPKNKGRIPSILLWILYGMTLTVVCTVGLGAFISDGSLVLIDVMAMIGLLHVFLFIPYLMLGGFQLYAIIKKRASSFVIFSFITNIVIFGLGWLIFLLLVIMATLIYA